MSSPCISNSSKIIVKDESDALGIATFLRVFQMSSSCLSSNSSIIVVIELSGAEGSRSRVQLHKVYKKSSLRFSSNSSKLVVRDESDTELGLGLVYSGNQQSTNASAVSQLINTNVTQGLSRVSLFPDATWREGGVRSECLSLQSCLRIGSTTAGQVLTSRGTLG